MKNQCIVWDLHGNMDKWRGIQPYVRSTPLRGHPKTGVNGDALLMLDCVLSTLWRGHSKRGTSSAKRFLYPPPQSASTSFLATSTALSPLIAYPIS